MAQGRGGVRQGAGRPSTGGTSATFNIFLGRDSGARELREDLETIQGTMRHRCLRETVTFLVDLSRKSWSPKILVLGPFFSKIMVRADQYFLKNMIRLR